MARKTNKERRAEQASPLIEAQQRAAELMKKVKADFRRQEGAPIPATMTPHYRRTMIDNTADLIRANDAMLVWLDVLEATMPDAAERIAWERSTFKGIRALDLALMKALNPDQAWFWTEEWQAKEREADADESAGHMTFHATTDDFLASLREEKPDRTELS